MEIAPIAGIRVLPAAKARPVHPELTVLFDIEATVRPDDDTYSRNGQKAAGAEEPEDEEDGENGEWTEEPQEAVGDEIGSRPAPEAPADRISFFA